MCNKSYTKVSKQIRIDPGWHKLLKLRAIDEERTLKELLEEILAEYFALDLKEI